VFFVAIESCERLLMMQTDAGGLAHEKHEEKSSINFCALLCFLWQLKRLKAIFLCRLMAWLF